MLHSLRDDMVDCHPSKSIVNLALFLLFSVTLRIVILARISTIKTIQTLSNYTHKLYMITGGTLLIFVETVIFQL